MAISAFVISAIAGCFYRESGVNPGIWESLVVPPDTFFHVWSSSDDPHMGGYGFGQFTNTRSEYGIGWRLANYYNWCVSQGYMPDNGNAQLDYIINVEKVWYNSTQQRGSYRTLEEFLQSDSTSLEDLVWDFLASWEGVPGDAYQIRLTKATEFYSYLIQHQHDDPNEYEWVSGNFYPSNEQTLNNLMCMFFYLEGKVPPTPPTPTEKKKRMPVWMMLKRIV